MPDAAEQDAKAWPVVSLAEAVRVLTAPGALFEMDSVTIAGVTTRAWKNAPRNLPALARHAREKFSASRFVVLGDERVSYEAWFRASAALAEEFQRRDIGRGDRVAVAMRNLPE